MLLVFGLLHTTPVLGLTSLQTRLLQILEDNNQEHEGSSYRRGIWKVSETTPSSVLVHMQRTTVQREEKGYWLLQYKCLDGCQPSEWTSTRDKFYKWNHAKLSVYFERADGKKRKVEGTVRLTDLVPGHTYGLRTLYSLKKDGSDSVVEPLQENGFEFETQQQAVDRKTLDNLEQRLLKLLGSEKEQSASERRELQQESHSEKRGSLTEDTNSEPSLSSLEQLLRRLRQKG